MDEKKRDRSEAGQWAAAVAAQRKAAERLQRLSDEKTRRAEGRARDELRELGSAALTAALTDPVFRATLISAARSKVLAEQKVIEIVLTGKLLTHLEMMPKPIAEPVERTPLPIIAVEASGAANVIRYAPLVLRSMSDQDLHTRIMALIGATYIDEIKCWACPHPAFAEIMRSVGRDLDPRIEGMQPDLACRYITVVRLEEALMRYSELDRQEALVEWEEIVSINNWMPETSETEYTFTCHSQSDAEPFSRWFSCLKDIAEAETEGEYRNEIERWNGIWSRDGQSVSVTEVQQALVFAIWAERAADAMMRLAKNESARDEWNRLLRERREAERLEEEKQVVRAAMKARRSKYGDNN